MHVHCRNEQTEKTRKSDTTNAGSAEGVQSGETLKNRTRQAESITAAAEENSPSAEIGNGNSKERRTEADVESQDTKDTKKTRTEDKKQKPQVAGSIHKEEVRSFCRDTLQADKFVLDILQNGYKLPFKGGCEPQRYREENNKSALERIDFAYEETERWESKKVVKEVWTPPLCISPLTVAARTVAEEEKLRLCLDLSRYINKLLRKEAVKLSGIDKCTRNLLPGDFIGTYDLTSAFHHVSIYEPHQQYLGFCLPGRKEGEKERYFIFLVMPFGLASAVKCITRMTKPLCGYISSQGIRHSIYIDDGNVLARALALVIAHLAFVLDALKKAGFVISEGKTDTAETVSQVKLYLGFVLDSQKMMVRISEEKLTDLRKALLEVTESRGLIKAKTLAKAIGKLVAAEPALGPTVQLLSRVAQNELAQITEERGWNVFMQVSDQAKESLAEMERELEFYNGYPVKNLATAKRLDTFIAPSQETGDKEAPAMLLQVQDTTRPRVIAGDASAVATCALEVGGTEGFFHAVRADTRGTEVVQRPKGIVDSTEGPTERAWVLPILAKPNSHLANRFYESSQFLNEGDDENADPEAGPGSLQAPT